MSKDEKQKTKAEKWAKKAKMILGILKMFKQIFALPMSTSTTLQTHSALLEQHGNQLNDLEKHLKHVPSGHTLQNQFGEAPQQIIAVVAKSVQVEKEKTWKKIAFKKNFFLRSTILIEEKVDKF